MPENFVTAPDCLAVLLPWLNSESMPPAEVGERLLRFLALAEGPLLVVAGTQTHPTMPPLPPHDRRQLAALRRDVRQLLEGAADATSATTMETLFSLAGLAGGLALPSLRFGVLRKRSRPDKMPRSRKARAIVDTPRAFRLVVSGRFRDVLLYMLMRTLTEPGAVSLARCPAPAPGDRSVTCGQLLVVSGKRRGRPAVYCSDACRVRAYKARDKEREEQEKERLKDRR